MEQITDKFRKVMREMARAEDTILQLKLLAHCDKCGELKRLIELEMKSSPITTEQCPLGSARGDLTVLVRQDAPRLICRDGCKGERPLQSRGFMAISFNCATLNHEGCGNPKICDCDCHARGKIT